MNLTEGKALLAGVQDYMIERQVHEHLKYRRACPDCGQRHTSKEIGRAHV